MPDGSPIEQLRAIVMAEPDLLRELRQTSDRASFVAVAVKCANERGCPLDTVAVEAALETAARAWLMRWVER
jgi:hypothetical protein